MNKKRAREELTAADESCAIDESEGGVDAEEETENCEALLKELEHSCETLFEKLSSLDPNASKSTFCAGPGQWDAEALVEAINSIQAIESCPAYNITSRKRIASGRGRLLCL